MLLVSMVAASEVQTISQNNEVFGNASKATGLLSHVVFAEFFYFCVRCKVSVLNIPKHVATSI